MKKQLIAVIFMFCAVCAFAQLRAFDQIFPGLDEEIRTAVFSDSGYVRASRKQRGFVILAQRSANLEPQIVNMVLSRNPGYVVESISILPLHYGTAELLDIYNALGNVRNLSGRLYDSATRNQAVPLFEEATRIVSDRQTTVIPDPPPAARLPQTETVFIRLRDANFGNTFYRGEMAVLRNGLRYTLSNFRSMSYYFVPVIRENRFVAQLYFEPIQEGVLIYSIAGTDISDFFASRIHVDSAISKRLAVINSWAIDGIINVLQNNR
ncbi:MAG: hypothetical protein LBC80_04020 [Treponema sp.]|jgi:hypothetical protein|nr:hypothetical protein [Treponema sp.]